MSFEENFLYPLGLLLVGGSISGGLIPLFNFLNKRKLLDVQRAHEASQKRIDRDREDYKFELEIKAKVLEKLSEFESKIYDDFGKLLDHPEENNKALIDEYINFGVKVDNQITDYIVLYFNSNIKIQNLWNQIYSMSISGCTLCKTKDNSPEREAALDKFLKENQITINEKDRKQSLESKGLLPQPLVQIYPMLRNLKLEIKTLKMNSG